MVAVIMLRFEILQQLQGFLRLRKVEAVLWIGYQQVSAIVLYVGGIPGNYAVQLREDQEIWPDVCPGVAITLQAPSNSHSPSLTV